jgi:Tfp pilus assembly protein PilP
MTRKTRYLITLLGIVAASMFFLNVQMVSAQDAPAPAEAAVQDPEMDNIPRAPEPEQQEKISAYNPQGARDPFVSLLEGVDKDVRPPGLAGMQISELTLQGIQIGLGKTAIVKGPDNIAYGMEVNESVFDGKLIAIDNNKVVFEKIIYDAFGREKEKQKIEVYLHRK